MTKSNHDVSISIRTSALANVNIRHFFALICIENEDEFNDDDYDRLASVQEIQIRDGLMFVLDYFNVSNADDITHIMPLDALLMDDFEELVTFTSND